MSCFYNPYQKRNYAGQYHRIYAKWFKPLLAEPIPEKEKNKFKIPVDWLSKSQKSFKLFKGVDYPRVMMFEINNQQIPVPLQTDNRSASNKLYLICPYCTKQKQSLFVLKNTYSCRDCANLHYACQSESKLGRLDRRIRKIRTKIWGADYPDKNNLMEASMFWPKPKGLHYSTFAKAQRELNTLEHEYNQLWTDRLKIKFSEFWGVLEN